MTDSQRRTTTGGVFRVLAAFDRRPGWAVFWTALAIRVAYCLVSVFILHKTTLGGGSHDGYLELAKNLVAGEGYRISDEPNLFRPPVYVLFLVPWVLLPGTLAWILGAQALIGAATCALVARVARSFVRNRLAWPAGLGLAFYPWHMHFTTNSMTPVVSTALAMALVACWLKYRRARRPLGALACGVVCGLLALCHPSAAPIGPVLVADMLYPVIRKGTRRSAIVCTALLCIGAALPVIPWAVRNYRATGTPVLLSNSGGFQYFLADHTIAAMPHLWSHPAEGITPGMRAAAKLLRENGLPVNEDMETFKGVGPAQGKFFSDWMKRDLREHPEKLVRRVVQQAWWFWFADRPKLTALHLLYKGPLLLLAVVGVWHGVRRRLPILPLVGAIIPVWAIHAVVMGYLPHAGYCIVVMGPLCILAALGLQRQAAEPQLPPRSSST